MGMKASNQGRGNKMASAPKMTNSTVSTAGGTKQTPRVGGHTTNTTPTQGVPTPKGLC